MASQNLLLLPGDGIGPEIMQEVKKVIAWFNDKGGMSFETSDGLVGGAASYIYVNGAFGGGEEEEEVEQRQAPGLRLLREPGVRPRDVGGANAPDESL